MYLQICIATVVHFKDFVIHKVTIKTCRLKNWRKKPMSNEKVFLEENTHIMQGSDQLFLNQKGNKNKIAWYCKMKSFYFRDKTQARIQKISTPKVLKKKTTAIEFRLSELSPQYEILLPTEDAAIGSSKMSTPKIRDEVNSKLKTSKSIERVQQNVERVKPATLCNKTSGKELLKLPLIPTSTMQNKGSCKILQKCKKYQS